MRVVRSQIPKGGDAMGLDDEGYYTLREILGYNAKINIVLSDRGRGKSWGTKWFLVTQEGKFMCLYRQSSDMQFAMKDWLDPLLAGDSKHAPMEAERFKWEGNDKEGWQLIVDGDVKGYFRYLTAVNHIKQEVFPDDLNWIWWDEFIPMAYKKLPGVASEGDALRVIMKTVEHDTVHTREEKGLKKLRVLMFANPFTWNNPVLSYFKVLPKYGIYRVGPDIVCEHLEPFKKEGKRGKMTMDEFLGDEVNKNQGWMDQMSFVKPIPKGSEPCWSVRLKDAFFTIYRGKNGRLYVSEKKEHTNIQKIYGDGTPVLSRYGTVDGLQEDECAVDNTGWLKSIQSDAFSGRLTYDTMNCKFDFLNRIMV